jgi:MFS family permease
MKPPKTSSILLSSSFLLSFFSFFFVWISFDFFILFPLFILRIGGNSIDVGFQEAVFFIPSVIVRPLFGWLVDRVGRVKLLWVGTALMVVSSLSFLSLHGVYLDVKWRMALILIVRGSGFAAFYTSFFTYVTDLTTAENRGRVIGLFGVSGLVAHGLAPWIGEKVLKSYDFSGFFLVAAFLSAVSLVISIFLKEQNYEKSEREKPARVLRAVAFSRRNVIFLPGAFVFGWVIASFNTFGAAFFETSHGAATVGIFFLVYGSCAGLFRILLGGIVDRYPRWLLITIFSVLQGVGISLVVLHPVQYFYLLSAATCGVAHAFLFPSMTAIAIDAHPDNRGVVTSIFTAMIELGFSLGSYVLGWVIAVSSYRVMFLSCTALAIVFAVYVWLSSRVQEPELHVS